LSRFAEAHGCGLLPHGQHSLELSAGHKTNLGFFKQVNVCSEKLLRLWGKRAPILIFALATFASVLVWLGEGKGPNAESDKLVPKPYYPA
jgi:hypothetical protein